MCARVLGALGHGTFCMECGAYVFTHVVLLPGQCPGRPKDAAAKWRLYRMVAGRHPANGLAIGQPRLIEPAFEA